MEKNDILRKCMTNMNIIAKQLDTDHYISGFLSDSAPRAYYKLTARGAYMTVSFKASSPDISVKIINARVCEEIRTYGISKAEPDIFIFPELFKSFDTKKHSPAGYVTSCLFPVTVSDIYLLSLSTDCINSNGCLFVLSVGYL